MKDESPKQREIRERRSRILAAARGIAEDDGWDAVTTRRLAEAIGHSQPVLYSHFPGGKSDIVTAVAVAGFAELADTLHAGASGDDVTRLKILVTRYLDFARDRPAAYEAMFVQPVGLAFAAPDSRAELLRAFAAIADTLRTLSRPPREVETAAEVFWGALHGLAMLERSGRLRPRARGRRIAALARLTAGAG